MSVLPTSEHAVPQVRALSDALLGAVSDASSLAPWAEANAVAVSADERVSELVRHALGGSVSPEATMGTPLLRWANTDAPAVPLVEAIAFEDRHTTRCDLCGAKPLRPLSYLWVPAGASVVELACCPQHRRALDYVCNADLVWR